MQPALRVLLALILFAFLLADISPAQAATPGFVIVNYGDTLDAIAARNGTTVDDLIRANGLPAATFIWAGQPLVIPSGNSVPAPISAPAGSGIYIVNAGDTLRSIAARFGVSVETLARTNGLSNVNYIFIGQRLNIPGAVRIPATQPTSTLPPPGVEGRWIDVDLSSQTTTAYDGKTALKTVLASTGVAKRPTPIGQFKVYLKVRSQTMSGGVGIERYVLPDVPWIMYFAGDNALHGTYWHTDFGRPKSHGCVNLTIEDARWFYNWAPVGTPVIVHP